MNFIVSVLAGHGVVYLIEPFLDELNIAAKCVISGLSAGLISVGLLKWRKKA